MKPIPQELLHEALELEIVCAHPSFSIGIGITIGTQPFVLGVYVVVIAHNLNLFGLGWARSCVSRLVSSKNPVVSLRRSQAVGHGPLGHGRP